MLMLHILAHAGETHSDSLEAVAHYTAPWYISLPLFFVIIGMIGYLTWLVSGKNFGTVLSVLAAVLLIIGFTLYSVSALVSGIAIVLGIMTAGFLALASLTSGK